jgi:hypothetical protein
VGVVFARVFGVRGFAERRDRVADAREPSTPNLLIRSLVPGVRWVRHSPVHAGQGQSVVRRLRPIPMPLHTVCERAVRDGRLIGRSGHARATDYERVPYVDRRFRGDAGLMFTSWCWWRSLAADGGPGTSRGDTLLSWALAPAGRPYPHAGVTGMRVLCRRPSGSARWRSRRRRRHGHHRA